MAHGQLSRRPTARDRLPPHAGGAHHALGERVLLARTFVERTADLQRPSDALLRREVGARSRRAEHGRHPARRRQLRRHHHHRLDEIRHDRRAGIVTRRQRRARGPRLPALDHPALLPRSRHRAALAFLLRLAVRAQRPRLSHLRRVERARAPRPRADARPAAPHRAVGVGARPLPLSRRARRRRATTCCRSSPTWR